MTFGDAATLAVVPIGAYVVGVFGVLLATVAQLADLIGLMAWLHARPRVRPQTELAFLELLSAQLWFEWRTKGVALPAIVGMGLFMGFGIWLLSSRNANALFEGCIPRASRTSSSMLAALLGGFVLGNVGRADSDIQIGQFLATRPLTNTQLANTILKTTARSVFFGLVLSGPSPS